MHLQAKKCQRLLGSHQQLGRGKEESFSYRFKKDHDPMSTLNLDFWP